VGALVEIFSPLVAAVPLWAPPRDLTERSGLAAVAAKASRIGVTRVTPEELWVHNYSFSYQLTQKTKTPDTQKWKKKVFWHFFTFLVTENHQHFFKYKS